MTSERDKVVAYLRGMAEMTDTEDHVEANKIPRQIRRAIAEGLRSAAKQICRGGHDDADVLFPQHLPRERIMQS